MITSDDLCHYSYSYSYYEPKIQWNWIYDHTVNRGFMHMQFSF